jgi:hypothetical protein
MRAGLIASGSAQPNSACSWSPSPQVDGPHVTRPDQQRVLHRPPLAHAVHVLLEGHADALGQAVLDQVIAQVTSHGREHLLLDLAGELSLHVGRGRRHRRVHAILQDERGRRHTSGG